MTQNSQPPDGPDSSQGGESADAALILAGLPHAFFVLDRDWRLRHVNPRAVQFLGRLAGDPATPLAGRDLREVCPDLADSQFVRQVQEALAEQQPWDFEALYPAINRWFAVHLHPAGERLCVHLQDITEATALARELRRANEQLAGPSRGAALLELAQAVRDALDPVRNALTLLSADVADPNGLQAAVLAEQKMQHLSRLVEELGRGA